MCPVAPPVSKIEIGHRLLTEIARRRGGAAFREGYLTATRLAKGGLSTFGVDCRPYDLPRFGRWRTRFNRA